MTTDWNTILSNRQSVSVAQKFATGNLSGSEFYSYHANTASGGEVRVCFVQKVELLVRGC